VGDTEQYWGGIGQYWVILGNIVGYIGVILGDIGQYWVILGDIV
jgi:hypothetical protein